MALTDRPVTASAPVEAEPASFRDPTNQVFYADGQVLRGLRGQAVRDWRVLAESEFFTRFVAQGKLCATEPVAAAYDGFELTLRHERVPFLSYPYEWTFSMLRDAALLHLELLTEAVSEGLITKDGSAYNLQWRGAEPVFIDIGSFERLRDGQAWAGYRQFCQTMLYPLLLTGHLGVPFQPWLRAQIDGIEPGQLRPLFGGLRRFKTGVLTHVHLHDAMASRLAGVSAQQIQRELRAAGYSSQLVLATLRKLRTLVSRLRWRPPRSHWQSYRETCSYSEADRQAKLAFVDAALAAAGAPELVLDLGANDGAFSRLAARYARHVVAVESDHAVTDDLYRRLRAEGDESRRKIQPLLVDLANPSPGSGWGSRERAAFLDRARADTVLALALVHHLAIGRNVPLPQVCDLLTGLGRRLVVEFVDPADPMAARLLANKPAGMFGDYQRDAFEQLLSRRGAVLRRQELPSGTRTLYLVETGG